MEKYGYRILLQRRNERRIEERIYSDNKIFDTQGADLYRKILEEARMRMSREECYISNERAVEIIEETVMDIGGPMGLSFREKKSITEYLFNITRRELDILQPVADDTGIREIMVNGPKKIFVEKDGTMIKLPMEFESQEHLEELIRRIAAGVHREINDINPIVDARLADGSRVNAVYGNVAIEGPILTIRKFPEGKMKMEDLIRMNTITEEAADYLKGLVVTGHNIFVSGGTSSGKTTFLNVLSDYIPSNERVIVIEDSAELRITEIDNIVRLETRNANSQGKGAVGIRELIKTAMRMRPDRMIIGEVRGGEALDMLQALNSGHDGCMSTGHAGSAEGMMYRLETMVLTAESFPLDAVRRQIATALDIVVHLGRFSDMSRKVLEISEVEMRSDGSIGMNRLFEYREGSLERTGNKLKNRSKIMMRYKKNEYGDY
ncbi:MAG: CpaF family protein [Firmicutes bacterium]|nr:CpaF family protein [Bacillota bacterium]